MSELDTSVLGGELRGRFGTPCRSLTTTGSTNSDALVWAEDGAPEGALVVADQQTEGRGRRGREWLSEPGKALLFSLVLRPKAGPSLSLLSTAVGVGACEALRRVTNLSVLLKWPNDLMVEDRKLAGILVESRSGGEGRVVAIAGMGLNVSWEPTEMPDEIAARGTSIAAEMRRFHLGDGPPREKLLAALLTGIERRYDQLAQGDVFDIVTTAESFSALVGREVVVRVPGGEDAVGMVTGLAQDGGLEVVTATGPRVLTAGEVEMVRPR